MRKLFYLNVLIIAIKHMYHVLMKDIAFTTYYQCFRFIWGFANTFYNVISARYNIKISRRKELSFFLNNVEYIEARLKILERTLQIYEVIKSTCDYVLGSIT